MTKFLLKYKIEDISEETVSSFLMELRNQKKSFSTINGYRSTIQEFCKFLKKTDIQIPTYLKIDKKLPDSFTEEYFLNTIIPIIEGKNGLKLKTICYFLFYSGIRISEIDTLKRKDFDLNNCTAKIYVPKTKEERIIFYTQSTKEIIEEYFDSEPEDFNAFGITSSSVKKAFDRLKKYFPDIKFRCHLFRHAFATISLQRGMDLVTVSQLLGHKNIQTTERYIGLNIAQKLQIYKDKWEIKK
jgi:integrase/recombinase XerD